MSECQAVLQVVERLLLAHQVLERRADSVS